MAKTIEIKILGDNKDFKRAINDTESKLGAFGRNAGKVAAVGLGALAVGGAAFGKTAYTAAVESQKIGAQTDAVIKSMGLEAAVTSDRIGDLATSLSLKNAVDDEAIQTGQNLLLTFQNLADTAGTTGGAFDRASQVMVDMGAAMGTDASASAIQLGKALNDPVKGITALTRVGVSFTEEQKEQIKAMTEAGDLAGAQGIILGELERQFGGSAAAQATAADRMKIAFGNFQEQVGEQLIPVIEKLSIFLTDKLLPVLARYLPPAIAAVVAAFKVAATAFTTIYNAVKSVVEFFQNNLPVFAAVATLIGGALLLALGLWLAATWAQVAALTAQAVAFALAYAPILAVIAVLALLAAGVVYAYQNFETFRAIVDAVREWFVDVLVPAIVTAWQSIRVVIDAVIGAVRGIIESFVSVIGALWDTFGADLIAYAQNAWDTISGVVAAAINIVRGVIQTVMSIIKGDWSGAWDGIKMVLSGVWDAIKAIVSGAIGSIKLTLSAAWTVIKSTMSAAWGALKGIVADALNGVIALAAGLPGRVLSAVGDLGSLLVDAGRDLVAGFINGIGDMAGALTDKVKSVIVDGTKNLVKSGFGIFSPSKVFAEYGVNVVAGFAEGLEQTTPLVSASQSMLTAATPDIADLTPTVTPISESGGQTINITVQPQIMASGPDLARQLQQLLTQYGRLSGNTLTAAR